MLRLKNFSINDITPLFLYDFPIERKGIKLFNRTKLLDFLVYYNYDIKVAKKRYSLHYYPLLKKAKENNFIDAFGKITEKGYNTIILYTTLQKVICGNLKTEEYPFQKPL